jgi:hypothetical protein
VRCAASYAYLSKASTSLSIVVAADTIESKVESAQRTKPARQGPIHKPQDNCTEGDEHAERHTDVAPFFRQFVRGIGRQRDGFVAREFQRHFDSRRFRLPVKQSAKPFGHACIRRQELRGGDRMIQPVDENRLEMPVAIELLYETLRSLTTVGTTIGIAHGRLDRRAGESCANFGEKPI